MGRKGSGGDWKGERSFQATYLLLSSNPLQKLLSDKYEKQPRKDEISFSRVIALCHIHFLNFQWLPVLCWALAVRWGWRQSLFQATEENNYCGST